MKRISILFLNVVATALVVVAKPSHSIIAALLHAQSGSGLYVRSGIDPSSIAPQCQPDCTPVIQKLDVCLLVPLVFAMGNCRLNSMS
jgi:hypothetical protein